jgi:HSP20 family protein
MANLTLSRPLGTLDRWFRDWDVGAIWGEAPETTDFVPSLDVTETDEAIEVHLEVPGVEEKDLDVSLTDDLLTISGEKRSEHEDKDDTVHRIERRYGRFSRTLRLPGTVDAGRVEASYEAGVLKVVLPKTPEAKPRRIEVKTN